MIEGPNEFAQCCALREFYFIYGQNVRDQIAFLHSIQS